MAFLDNSGDIILDAVLTDAGRKRLAQGDGSFKVTKFAFGDDEIDYASYDGDHPSGSAYYDLEILQTPIFEAFTNNTSTMKTKLISLTNNNLLFLPVIKLNEKMSDTRPTDAGSQPSPFGSGSHVVYVDQDTRTALTARLGNESFGTAVEEPGYLNGYETDNDDKHIRVDQGLDTDQVSPSFLIDPELKETQYIVELDSRLLRIYDIKGDKALAAPSFIDDDLIASYYITQNVGNYVQNMTSGPAEDVTGNGDNNIEGPRGTKLRIGLLAALDVASSDYLFNTIGNTVAGETDSAGNNFAFIDTTIKIIGVTTGYRIDVPVRLLKIID